MKATDVVDMIVLTKNNHVFFVGVTRQRAGEFCKLWYDLRKKVFEQKEGYEQAERQLQYLVVGSNFPVEDSPDEIPHTVVALSEVVGAYIKERETDADTANALAKETVENQRRIIELVQKQMDDAGEAEQWKQRDIDEDEEELP